MCRQMILRIVCLLLLADFTPCLPYRDDYLNQLVLKYVYSHEKECGDPFADPAWLPALDDCKLQCEETRFICKLSTEDQNLQHCHRLPHDCAIAIRKSLGWSEDEVHEISVKLPDVSPNFNKQLAISARKRKISSHPEYANQEAKSEYATEVQPMQPDIDSRSKSSCGDHPYCTPEVDKPSEAVFDAYAPPAAYPDYGGFQSNENISIEVETTTVAEPVTTTTVITTTRRLKFGTPTPPVAPPVFEPIPMGYEIPYDIEHPIEVEVTTPRALKRISMPSIRPDYYRPQSHTKEELLVVPHLQTNQFADTEIHRVVKPVDKSRKCCEWALQGLCDMNWKKVRKMCPVSCGSLHCEEIEGIRTCSRVINVDIEQCFETVRLRREIMLARISGISPTSYYQMARSLRYRDRRRLLFL